MFELTSLGRGGPLGTSGMVDAVYLEARKRIASGPWRMAWDRLGINEPRIEVVINGELREQLGEQPRR